MNKDRLGIGIIGSGFNARFHLQAFAGVRDADVVGLWSPNEKNAAEAARLAQSLGVGEPRLHRSIARMVADPAVQAIWLFENQLFAPSIQTGREIIWNRSVPLTGRPYLAPAAEEHSGPHKPWFWRGDLQGGGVLNDMMCHSVMRGRHLLTPPGASYSSLKPTRW